MANDGARRVTRASRDRRTLSEHGATLSMHRAFVVHFGSGGTSGRHRFAGTVEHLSSGRSVRFSSLKGLLVFVVAILDASRPVSPPGPGARPRPPVQPRLGRPPHPRWGSITPGAVGAPSPPSTSIPNASGES